LRLSVLDDATLLATARQYARISSGQLVGFQAPGEVVSWPPVTFTLSYQNLSTAAQEVTGTVDVYDDRGQPVASLSAGPVSVGAGQIQDIDVIWDPHGAFAGEYAAVALAQAGGREYGPQGKTLRIVLCNTYLPLVVRNQAP
jgi:hypothetical protein